MIEMSSLKSVKKHQDVVTQLTQGLTVPRKLKMNQLMSQIAAE